MDKDEIIKDLQERYPEDLNKEYNCYWWYTCSMDNNVTYYLLLRDKFEIVGKTPLNCLRAHSSDPESLVNLLKLYLETCKY